MFSFYNKNIDTGEYDKDTEYYYLSNNLSYGKSIGQENQYYYSKGILNAEEKESRILDEQQFRELISREIRQLVFAEKHLNIVFLAGAGASVAGVNSDYGKTVNMIADDIYVKLSDEVDVYNLTELAEISNYNNGKILSENGKLADTFNLEDFLSTILNYRQFVKEDKEKFEKSIECILKLIKSNTEYSYDDKDLKHRILLKMLSDLAGNEGHKFSVVTTNYDVLIEQAAAEDNFIVFDGFNFTESPKFDSNMFDWNLVRKVHHINTRELEYKDKVFNLIKIHGSLTWEKQDNGEIIRKEKNEIEDISKVVMIFPSSDKYAQSYQEPYFELFTKFQELLRYPNTLLITAGFSFSDFHIAKMVIQAVKNNPSLKLLVTDYNISPNRVKIENEDTDKNRPEFRNIEEKNPRFNHNWEELIKLMSVGYSIRFLKATLNDDLIDYLKGSQDNETDQ